MFKQLGRAPANCSVVEREATQRESTHVPWGDVDGTPCFALQYLRRHPSFLCVCVSPSYFPWDLSRLCVPSYFDESSVSPPSFLCTFLTFSFIFLLCFVVLLFFFFYPHSELSKDPLPRGGRVEWCWSSCSSCHQHNMTGLTNSPIMRSKGERYDLPRNEVDQNFTEVQYGSYSFFIEFLFSLWRVFSAFVCGCHCCAMNLCRLPLLTGLTGS